MYKRQVLIGYFVFGPLVYLVYHHLLHLLNFFHAVNELVIHSNGSVVSGTDQGAYAMVVTSCDVSNPTRLGFGGGWGLPFTSSFEMEALSLSLAVDYVVNTEVGEPVLICTDSLSVLSALVGSKPHVFQEITKLRRKLGSRTLWTTWELSLIHI